MANKISADTPFSREQSSHETQHLLTITNSGSSAVRLTPQSSASILSRNDFNGDGYADILWFNSSTRQVALWSLQGDNRVNTGILSDALAPEWTIVGSGDMNGDGRSDILFRSADTGHVAIWTVDGLSRSSGRIITESDRPMPASTEIAGMGDFNGDGQTDVLMVNSSNINIVALMEETLPTHFITIQWIQDSQWTNAGTGDFNGDGKDDILRYNTSTGQTIIEFMDGNTRMQSSSIQGSVALEWTIQGTGDFDGDGTADILWRHSDGRVAVWLMDGATRTDAGILNTDRGLADSWVIADTADFDGDGVDDILLQNQESGAVALWTVSGVDRTSGRIVQGSVSPQWQIMNTITS